MVSILQCYKSYFVRRIVEVLQNAIQCKESMAHVWHSYFCLYTVIQHRKFVLLYFAQLNRCRLMSEWSTVAAETLFWLILCLFAKISVFRRIHAFLLCLSMSQHQNVCQHAITDNWHSQRKRKQIIIEQSA
jgi:hypothetical protein